MSTLGFVALGVAVGGVLTFWLVMTYQLGYSVGQARAFREVADERWRELDEFRAEQAGRCIPLEDPPTTMDMYRPYGAGL